MRGGPGKTALIAVALLAGGCTSNGDLVETIAVSGPSPFRTCTVVAPVYNPSSMMIADSEVEPSLAVSPKNPNVLIGVYQQDRWSGGQARGIVASVSQDGGKTWRQVLLPLSECGRGSVPAPRAGDPWVSIGPDGTAYAIATGTGIAVTASGDEGLTWSDPSSLDERTACYFPDKPTITADPGQAGVVYAVWARVITDITFDAVFAKSTDFGRLWSPAKVLIEHTHDGGAISGQILVAASPPMLYHLTGWEEGAAPGPDALARILIQRSSDAGLTWSKPATVLDVRTLGYARSGARGSFVRTGVEVPDFAIDPSSGTLYATWQDARFSGGGYDEVAFSSSADGGDTWSSPSKINQTSGDLAAIPVVAVGADGAVGISYYSFHFGEGRSPPIDARVFLAVSTDGGRTFATKRLAGPVDAREAPQVLVRDGPSGQSYFLGDYAGLDALGSGFAALFALPNPESGDPADVFFTRA